MLRKQNSLLQTENGRREEREHGDGTFTGITLTMAKMRCLKGWGAKLGHAGVTAATRENRPMGKPRNPVQALAINI